MKLSRARLQRTYHVRGADRGTVPNRPTHRCMRSACLSHHTRVRTELRRVLVSFNCVEDVIGAVNSAHRLTKVASSENALQLSTRCRQRTVITLSEWKIPLFLRLEISCAFVFPVHRQAMSATGYSWSEHLTSPISIVGF